jgi:hypothetical protein
MLGFLAFNPFWALSGSMQVGSSEVLEPHRWYFFGTLLISLVINKRAWGHFFRLA